MLKKECNSARWEHINNLAKELKENNNAKPFWNYVKSKRKGTNNLVSIKVGDSTITDDASIAESMNSYFSSVFTSENYGNFPDMDHIINTKLSDIHCSSKEVEKHLRDLNVYKSPGPDYIPPRILKECASELSPSLTTLLNKSFTTGSLPSEWKMADITPIHKKGPKNKRENYRQISLTSIVCKISEKLVRVRVVKFWRELHDVFNPNQFAYLSGKSSVAQLLSSFDDWASARNSSKPTDIAFLDLSKAFDSVPHERLLLKLNRHGIEGPLLTWFRNFLTNRQQRVVIRGTCSNWSPVKSGVPQGTILGPILFLIYINDISDSISSKVKLFADDTKVYRVLNDITNDALTLQSDLNSLNTWATKWQLTFNPEKCEIMRITHKRDDSKPSYSFCGKILRQVNSTKDVGITVCSDLSWSHHVTTTVSKANKVLGLIKRTVGTTNPATFSMLYTSLVRPILEYATSVWSPYLVKDITALEKVQRRASRLALRQKRGEMPYEDRCKTLNWLTLEKRRKYLSLVDCYKTVFELNGLLFNEFFEYSKMKSTRANHNYKLQVKSARINCYKHSFFVSIVKSWNSLPSHIVEAGNIALFKTRLKSYMDTPSY